MAERPVLLVGTRKGAFVIERGKGRDTWSVRGPLCEGWPIHDVTMDRETGAILAGGGSPWYGPAVWRSDDLGETWTHSSEGLTYGDDGPKVPTVWNVTAAHGSIYAGVEPAGLFRSDDDGATWQHVEGLRNHPTRPEWQPGAGGLCLHSIVPHPSDKNRLWVGISAVGAFETSDGGKTWETRNKGVRADFHPDKYPEFGQCVHKLVMAPDGGELLYQQNHCGVYRSTNGGREWQEITPGLPSQFGFPMAAHPRDPQTVWTIPLNGDDRGRYMPDASAAVWRTNDGGGSWTRF
ncbi:MAG: exo-alpha-sialidase, partial [Chloroflexota bacterium]